MTERKPGRPRTKQCDISAENIISKAIDILDEKGIEQLSMRLIAKEMSITPMAIYHYFTDKKALIKAIANTLYQDINIAGAKENRSKIEYLLLSYREMTTRYPQITLVIFSDHTLFPEQATRITETLIHLLTELGLPAMQATQYAHMLIDYTHGEALAAANLKHGEKVIYDQTRKNYTCTLKMLLNNMISAIQT